MSTHLVLIGGVWRPSDSVSTFRAINPQTGTEIPEDYPVSSWNDVDAALQAAAEAAAAVRGWSSDRFADFLEANAAAIESRADQLVEMAHTETALPVSPRLKDVELPRTTGQLRQAAAAARDGSWVNATIDTQAGIRSMFGPIGPVAVFGPNNFPFAFNGAAGGDYAAAIAAGNPVIAKGHTSHPGTSRLLAEAAQEAAEATGMPAGWVQMIYRTQHSDGLKLAADPRLAAIGYTGARNAGLALKEVADKHGKPIYLELSSINPVFVLPGVLAERSEALADEFSGSCLMGTGQFCTNPGIVVLPATKAGETFRDQIVARFEQAATGTMLGERVRESFLEGVQHLQQAGAELLTGGTSTDEDRVTCANTVLTVSADRFLTNAEALQAEAFGNGCLLILADVSQFPAIAAKLEGNLTGCVYSATDGSDDALYDVLATELRPKVGRLLNDKMPTGVAVSPAMNHGGPFPATGHPGFTSVGIPTSIHRFSMLQCYDNVRPHRLPAALQNASPNPSMWRYIDRQWMQGDVPV